MKKKKVQAVQTNIEEKSKPSLDDILKENPFIPKEKPVSSSLKWTYPNPQYSIGIDPYTTKQDEEKFKALWQVDPDKVSYGQGLRESIRTTDNTAVYKPLETRKELEEALKMIEDQSWNNYQLANRGYYNSLIQTSIQNNVLTLSEGLKLMNTSNIAHNSSTYNEDREFFRNLGINI